MHTGRVAAATLLVALFAVAGCSSPSRPLPVGDPDPGHRIMQSLTPVLGAVPAGSHVKQRQLVEPRWDSCDGIRSTYGWNDVTVVEVFASTTVGATLITELDAGLRTAGWTRSQPFGQGNWYWQRTLTGGARASLQLLGPSEGDRAGTWYLQAMSPAATHPITGC